MIVADAGSERMPVNRQWILRTRPVGEIAPGGHDGKLLIRISQEP